METRFCEKCQRDQPISLFIFKGTVIGGYLRSCLECKPGNKKYGKAGQPRPQKIVKQKSIDQSHGVLYHKYLQSLEWHALREKVYARDEYRCVSCGSKDYLQAHHKTYKRLGHEELSDLVTLCGRCHQKEHGLIG